MRPVSPERHTRKREVAADGTGSDGVVVVDCARGDSTAGDFGAGAGMPATYVPEPTRARK
jgi:hypothetical protein